MSAKLKAFVRLLNKGKNPLEASKTVGYSNLTEALLAIQSNAFHAEIREQIKVKKMGPEYLLDTIKYGIDECRKTGKLSCLHQYIDKLSNIYDQAFPQDEPLTLSAERKLEKEKPSDSNEKFRKFLEFINENATEKEKRLILSKLSQFSQSSQ